MPRTHFNLVFNISMRMRSRLASFGMGTGYSYLVIGVITFTRSSLSTYDPTPVEGTHAAL
ncbi:hypothetical protein ARMSODRAFT_967262 [Armillaria solidipes]|uniref:Uncharacterized protein n=1 Tax=Armillaria solidipes TaxID=1076256 RepID=A0A2H3AQI3_9AGAR|nr:hypothetical protein ARMSODRAFT_967262 [Armillaria solidipes]